MPCAIKSLLAFCLIASFRTLTFAAGSTTDTQDLQGQWKPVSAMLAGQPMAEAVIKSISLKMDGGKYQVLVNDVPDRGTYRVDSSTEPKSMTVTGTEGPSAGKTFHAIYELKGDTLRVCYDLSGGKPPAEFKSVAETFLFLVTYQRTKD